MKTKALLFLLVVIYCIQGYAQPAIVRQHAYGAPDEAFLTDMKLTADGGTIMGGYSRSIKGLDKSENSKGPVSPNNEDDYWVVKTDNTGKVEWDRTIGGYRDDELRKTVLTKDHGYLLAGVSSSYISGDKTQPNHEELFPGYDYWIVKLDSMGNKQWDKTFGGNQFDFLTSADTTSDGGYILGGYSASAVSHEKTEGPVGGNYNYDFWIVKVDANGNEQWDKTIGGTSDETLNTVQQTKDGGYIAGGASKSNSFGYKTENSRGENDFWVVKLDAAGNVLWDKTIGGAGVDFLTSIVPNYDGGYIAGGSSSSDISGEKTQNSKGGLDYWIVKLNSTGQIEQDRTIGGNFDDQLASMERTKDSGLIISGSSASGISGDKTEKHRGTGRNRYDDYWVVKFSKRGNIEWDKTIGGDNGDYPSAVHEYKKNIYIVAGTSFSGITYDRTVPSKGGIDYWIVQLNYQKANPIITAGALPAAMRSNTIAAANRLLIYPNPVKDYVTVQGLSTNETANISIVNGIGILLAKGVSNGSAQYRASTANLQPGTYYLHITTGSTTETLKFVKE